MGEVVKRLSPTLDTIRELFGKSGNRCAFPGCAQNLLDIDGNFIAQVCHIEAAEEGGERFNPEQSNEDRRGFKNLLLMCYPHHVITNDVAEYTVERMQEIKRTHEVKFTNVEERIHKSIVDEMSTAVVRGGVNLKRLGTVLEWKLGDDEMADMVADFAKFHEMLKEVPSPLRELLVSMVTRAKRVRFSAGRGKIKVAFKTIAMACNIDKHTLIEYVGILEGFDIAYGEDDEETRVSYIYIRDLKSGWQIWENLLAFSKATGTPLHDLLVNLNFKSLDE